MDKDIIKITIQRGELTNAVFVSLRALTCAQMPELVLEDVFRGLVEGFIENGGTR